MNCKIARELSDAYLDGLLPDAQKREFEAHLQACPECSESIRQMREMLGFLSSMEEVEVPEGFHSRLHERLQAIAEEEISAASGIQHFPLHKKWLKWGAGLAAAVVLLLSVRLAAQLDDITGQKSTVPDVTTEQNASGQSAANVKMLQKSAEEQGNTSDTASDSAGELAEAPEASHAPLTVTFGESADKKEDSEEAGKADEDGIKLQPVESDIKMSAARTALSGEFNLYVPDTAIALNKISVIAASIGMTIKDETDESVVLLVTDEDQRKALYDSLAKLGRVEDLEIFNEENTVIVHVIFEK